VLARDRMIRAYRYLFYTLYRQQLRWKHDVAPPEVSAFLLTSAILFCSLLLVVEIADLSLGGVFVAKLSKTGIILALTLFTIPQYFVLLHKGRYKQIARGVRFRISAQTAGRKYCCYALSSDSISGDYRLGHSSRKAAEAVVARALGRFPSTITSNSTSAHSYRSASIGSRFAAR
jgi:hypothetical protein